MSTTILDTESEKESLKIQKQLEWQNHYYYYFERRFALKETVLEELQTLPIISIAFENRKYFHVQFPAITNNYR